MKNYRFHVITREGRVVATAMTYGGSRRSPGMHSHPSHFRRHGLKQQAQSEDIFIRDWQADAHPIYDILGLPEFDVPTVVMNARFPSAGGRAER